MGKLPRTAECATRKTVTMEWPSGRRVRLRVGDYVRLAGWDTGYWGWDRAIFQIKHFDSSNENMHVDIAWLLPIQGFPNGASTKGMEMEDGLLPTSLLTLIHVSPLIALALQAEVADEEA